ncbi:MAG: spondin domain-containing protein [Rhodospirillales bacterium]|nr:spondin domain-containing protein [Rhodospirillales bacterium]
MRVLRKQRVTGLFLLLVMGLAWAASASAANITVYVENLAPPNGTLITPVGVFFHDGSFDIGNIGQAASPALERLVEDGNLDPLFATFDSAGRGTARGAVFGTGGPLQPGEKGESVFNVDIGHDGYVSFASMVIPSNDAFIFNDNPTAYSIRNADGKFQPLEILVLGNRVYDAGTEVNDEIPANTAALAQAAPNTGVTENGVIAMHEGFAPGGNILDAIPNGDFTQAGYQVARISVVPVPAALPLFVTGLGALVALSRRRRVTATPA